jgi:phospholipase/carboxylesterase
MDRRALLTIGAAGAFSLLSLSAPPRVLAQAPAGRAPVNAQPPAGQSDDIPYGESRLGLDPDRDATLFVPKSYKDKVPMPLMLMLHGFSGSAGTARSAFAIGEELGVLVLAPESRDTTWGQSAPGFDDDGKYIAAAIRYVDSFLYIDKTRVGIAGVSDGATYAMSMGLSYGNVFNHVMGFSEGIIKPFRKEGKPMVYIAHGVSDVQMPIDRTSRKLVPELKSEGYDVTYHEYDGGHGAPQALIREGMEWLVSHPQKP